MDYYVKMDYLKMDLIEFDVTLIHSVVSRRNNISRKSLTYKTPLEIFLSYIDRDISSILI